jgi:hypothetical protein
MGVIEYTNITLKMLIDMGLIKPGTILYSSSKPMVTGEINDDGSITLDLNNQTLIFQSPSGAARAIRKSSVNGWTFWKIFIENEYKDLSILRKKYTENKEPS